MADEALPAKVRFGETIAAVERAMRRHRRPDELVLVALIREEANALTEGIACERLWLRRRTQQGELAELVVKPPDEQPAFLVGWSPTGRPARGWPRG